MDTVGDSDGPGAGAEWLRQMVQQLERTEKASFAQHEAFQKQALVSLLTHAVNTIPAYRKRLKPLLRFDGSVDLDGWADIPVLERRQAVALGDELVAGQVPDDHLPVGQGQTSGSTGEPFCFKITQFSQSMRSSISARYHRWHGIDYRKNMAAFRPFKSGIAMWPEGARQTGWGATPVGTANAGAYFSLNINTPVDQQIDWLTRVKAHYLHSFPSNLHAIALAVLENGGPRLQFDGILCFGEVLSDDAREIINMAFGQKPIDCYSSNECGYLALQSPASDNYLVQSEVNLVEILNEENLPCGPGDTGRVVVTSLHNYAQPLIRYVIGDYAVVGSRDKSGLPFAVLTKISGRSRNLFRLPGGRLVQPDFKTATFMKYLKPRQWQVAQTGPLALEVRIVPGNDSFEMDTDGMSEYIRQLLGDDLTIKYKLVSQLKNPRTGKHEDYICEHLRS